MEQDQWVADPEQDGGAATALRPRRQEPVQRQKAKRQHRLQFQVSSPHMYRGTRQVTLYMVWAEAVSPGDAGEDSEAAAADAADAAADVEEGDSGKGVVLSEGRYCKRWRHGVPSLWPLQGILYLFGGERKLLA